MISTRHHGSMEEQAKEKEEKLEGEADMDPSITKSVDSKQGISDFPSSARPSKTLRTRGRRFQDLNQDLVDYTDWLAMESERQLNSSCSEKVGTPMPIGSPTVTRRKPLAVDPTIEIGPRVVELENDEHKPASSPKTSTTPAVETRGESHSFRARTIQVEDHVIGILRRAQQRRQDLLSRGHSWKKHLFENRNT